MSNKRKDSKGRVLRKGESERKDGIYMYRYTDLDGSRKTIYTSNLNDLREQEKLIQRDIDDGIGYKAGTTTFNEYFEKYLELKGNISPSTKRNYKRSWENYIKNTRFGNMTLKDITKSDVILLLKSMSEKGLGKPSINTIVAGVLSPCMKMAVEDNIIRSNPCINCRKEIRGEDTEPEDVLTTVQQDNFLTYIKNSKYAYYYPLFVFMLETALRVGEVCGLTWDDVDLEHGFVNITHQLQYSNAGKDACQYQMLTPKSKSGIRNVPLSNAARDALMEQMQNQIEMDKKTEIEVDGYKDFVFSNRQSKPFITQTIGRILSRIEDDYNADIKKFGDTLKPLPHIHPHLLRHTACSRMAEAGIDPRTLQDIMGHASMRMTMELYNHVTDERLTNEIQKLNNRRIS